ncbi:hypothetical protein ACFQAS_14000 [Halopenitus salinus]|jgi:hypothetical protein|nr:hypothetical protein [Halobacterium salinarum]MCF2206410.1 hypothetical protein [Halobacterium salinarum]MCF2240040.1 hypothetical protein [Halobacterium salinarum]
MRPPRLRGYLNEEFEFPVDRAGVIERAGDVTVDAPDDDDSESISAMLERDNDNPYETLEDLFASIYGSLDDSYIGRKYYDDRGSNVEEVTGDYPRDERNVSF